MKGVYTKNLNNAITFENVNKTKLKMNFLIRLSITFLHLDLRKTSKRNTTSNLLLQHFWSSITMKSQWKSHVNGKNVLVIPSISSVLFDVLNNDVTAYRMKLPTVYNTLEFLQAAFSFDNLIYWQYFLAKYISCVRN